ncbi:MAG: RNA polymerase sigma factor, partial [Planctomycetota bacterium]
SIHGQTEDDTDIPLPDEAPGPSEDSEIRETQQELWKSLERLPMKHREIILLRHFQELDYQSIADVLEIPIGTVMSRLFHARRKLKEVMLPYMEAHK